MANNNYWQDRAIELEKKTHQISKDGYDELVPEFEKAKKEIQAKIDTWLARIADNNNVSLERAKEMLDNKELKDFKMDINEYIQYGMENELDQRWMKELENASAKHHIEKLTALKIQVEAEYQKVFAKEEQVVSDTIKEAYKDRYYRTAYEIESTFKLENTIGTINEKKLNNIINKPWAADGSNFSDRIWIKKDQMVDSLYKEMVRNLIQGESLKDTIANMTKFVDSSNKNAKYCAARLIQTESAYFASKSQYECYNDLDVEEYEIVATLDNHTSDICQRMDGQHFKMSEYEPGVTAPPFHVFCRSTTCPYFNDEFSYGSRAARGIDGKTYDVNSKLTYKEWFKTLKSKDSFIDKRVIIPKNYHEDNNEIAIANTLAKVLNTKIELLKKKQIQGRKNPDALIKNEYYEFKTPKSNKGIDSRVKEGLIQVEKNNGRLVLDVKNCDIQVNEMIRLIQHRVSRSLKNEMIDILLINTETNELINQKQYKK